MPNFAYNEKSILGDTLLEHLRNAQLAKAAATERERQKGLILDQIGKLKTPFQ